jgi:pimeloyl-ACP methyl ester carboxylesterase
VKIHQVTGGRGVKLHVREWGLAGGKPILFIHGWSQNHLSWARQYEDRLAEEFRIVALDLRGHGMSEGPLESAHYTDGDAWADDIAAVIEQLGLDSVTLVGWSYGGFVISDYVRKYGQGKVAGINFVGAAVVLGEKAFGTLIGPGFLDHAPPACSEDAPTAIAGVQGFLRACFVSPVAREEFETAVAYNMLVSPLVRGFLTQRTLDFASVLAGIEIPILVTHGREDSVVLPAMGDYILAHCPTAKASWYEQVGHAPFLEAPDRFNQELRALVRG